MASSLGKMPTTLMRRLTSAWSRLIGLVERSSVRWSLGKVIQGEDVVLGLVHEGGELGCLGPEPVGGLAPLGARRPAVALGEGGGGQGGGDAPFLSSGMGQRVAHEVDATALPCRAEDVGRGRLQPLAVVGDHQFDAAQPALGERAQEVGPEGLGPGRADRHAEHLAAALVVDRHRDGGRDRNHAPGPAHLHIGRIQPRIGPVTQPVMTRFRRSTLAAVGSPVQLFQHDFAPGAQLRAERQRDAEVEARDFLARDGAVSTLPAVRVDERMGEVAGTGFDPKAKLVPLAMGSVHPVHEGMVDKPG